MAANDNNPGIPKNPATPAVATLIGTCNPILPPNAFKRKSNMAPMTNLISSPPTKRSGFKEVPRNNKTKINPTIIDTTTIGSNRNSPSF